MALSVRGELQLVRGNLSALRGAAGLLRVRPDIGVKNSILDNVVCIWRGNDVKWNQELDMTGPIPRQVSYCLKEVLAMNDKELCKLLEQLHSEIEATQSVDEKEREMLRDLDADIQDLLERCKAEQVETHPITIRRLEDAIDYMTVNHPTLTAMLSNMLNTLSNAGV
jgi:hypothetical protein